ncbi:E2-like enzyme [Cichlidogyrus casuarinus]|uniref:Ubiquitin-like-conjugating enzyme ATG3 n=1 Tax=Cichlidogyrus casuarinus TaxID=1844966 RepID=A0ABD2QDD9_9PLAT
MDSIRQTAHRKFLEFADKYSPVLKDSQFRTLGTITPEEFVISGDFLVHHFPTWKWGIGDEANRRTFLPSNKQYLFTKNVPCYKRLNQINCEDISCENLVEGEDGWIETSHLIESIEEDSKQPDDTEMDCRCNDSASDEEPADMDAIMESGLLDDPCEVEKLTIKPASTSKEDALVKTRTYDLFITYDNYYKTPRLWLTGYDENGKPLEETQMYEDISQDHANKTVTFEKNLHLGQRLPSIHPCKQAEIMKKLISTAAEGGSEIDVTQYLMIFLKFVSAVIPTIEYDFTRDFTLS